MPQVDIERLLDNQQDCITTLSTIKLRLTKLNREARTREKVAAQFTQATELWEKIKQNHSAIIGQYYFSEYAPKYAAAEKIYAKITHFVKSLFPDLVGDLPTDDEESEEEDANPQEKTLLISNTSEPGTSGWDTTAQTTAASGSDSSTVVTTTSTTAPAGSATAQPNAPLTQQTASGAMMPGLQSSTTMEQILAMLAAGQIENRNYRAPRDYYVHIKEFSGDVRNYREFRGTFHQIIAKYGITCSEAVTTLRMKLKGEAFERIESLDVSEESYEAHWTVLDEAYNNPRGLVAASLQSLYDASIHSGGRSRAALIKLSFTTTNVSKNFKNMKLKTMDLLSFIALARMDPATGARFEDRLLVKNQIPTITQITDFLNSEVQMIDQQPRRVREEEHSAKHAPFH